MEVEFRDSSLKRLESEPGNQGLSPAIVNSFRRRVQAIRAASDERDFYALKSLHYEKLKGERSHQRSMKINDQWRLIVEMEGAQPDKVVVVVGIEDYH